MVESKQNNTVHTGERKRATEMPLCKCIIIIYTILDGDANEINNDNCNLITIITQIHSRKIAKDERMNENERNERSTAATAAAAKIPRIAKRKIKFRGICDTGNHITFSS